MNDAIKRHKKKAAWGGGAAGLGGVLYLLYTLNLSLPALQAAPETMKRVTQLEVKNAALTEEVSLLRESLAVASKERAAVMGQLEVVLMLQHETRDDIKELMRR